MLIYLTQGIAETNSAATTIISIAVMLFLGFATTRLTEPLRLPNVTAYILAGILIGPYCLNLIPTSVIAGTDFLSDIALAFIAFSTGEFFTISALKKNGLKVVLITIMEACLATVFVFIVTYCILGIDLVFSIVLSALASATAPASTVMTIEYSVAISLALAVTMGSSHLGVINIVKPIVINIAVLLLGGLFGVFLKLLMPQKRSKDNRLIISVSLLFAFCGICAILDVSPLLGCMSMGTVYINITGDGKLFKQLNYFTPPILLLFFVRSGVSFQLDALVNTSVVVGNTPLLVVGIVYFLTRIVGKYAGAFGGCWLSGKRKEVRNYLGLALIPQAGVAIGLAALGARTLGGETGVALETVILASSILYELIGPACAKLSLYLSKSYSTKLEDLVPTEEVDDNGEQKSAVELLIERIQAIQTEIPHMTVSDEEQAFLEAAEEQIAALSTIHTGAVRNRRSML